MIKKNLFVALLILFSPRVFAQAVVYDPSAYVQMLEMIKQAEEMYTTAKENLDKMVSIEKTMREAQAAYDTLSKLDLQQATKGLMPGKESDSSFAALRAQIANTEGKVNQNSNFVTGNLDRVRQLENLEILKRASVTNLGVVAGAPNAATSAKVAAQSSATLAALAAAEEQRRIKEEIERSQAAKLEKDNFTNSKKVYEAMGK